MKARFSWIYPSFCLTAAVFGLADGEFNTHKTVMTARQDRPLIKAPNGP